MLDLAYDASGLRLLIGTSESGNACCSTVKAVSLLRTGRFGRPSTIAGQLTGATLGSLTPLPSGQLLATIATDRGVWVAQSRAGGAFGATRRLTPGSAMPWTAAATADGRGQTTVAWAATTGQQGEIAPNRIMAATGSERGVPGGTRTVVAASGGRRIGELGLAPLASGATLAWTESWFDSRGVYQAQTYVSDLSAGARPRPFPIGGQIASGLRIAGDAAGDEVVTWKSCNRSGSCTAVATVRPAGARIRVGSAARPDRPRTVARRRDRPGRRRARRVDLLGARVRRRAPPPRRPARGRPARVEHELRDEPGARVRPLGHRASRLDPGHVHARRGRRGVQGVVAGRCRRGGAPGGATFAPRRRKRRR